MRGPQTLWGSADDAGSAGAPDDLGGLSDPTAGIEALRDTVQSLQKVGREEVDGVPTTHYTATVDAGADLGVGGLDDGSPLASLPSSYAYEIWVDDAGRPVRTSTDLAGMAMVMTYSNWDDPSIAVVAPGADEITDVNPLADIGGGES
ncbi:LppX_LprAFG lipoprotein [Cellulomonas composti]|uniref:Uncharacterized protein n=1 Tax=Cellulomonas composti TaxID=266130 RepID=A0A511J8U4_9CELL|nr:LppX_LprAFG lipoprotein [Cellulomonas composti]GEL94129.1 hypothetical protein CCO02nite_07870 [Cellulomonas composti]